MSSASINKPLPLPISRWTADGMPTQAFREWAAAIDAFMREAGTVNAANDGAAAALGVQVGHVYRNGSVLMIRVT